MVNHRGDPIVRTKVCKNPRKTDSPAHGKANTTSINAALTTHCGIADSP